MWPYQIDWSATGSMLTGIGTTVLALGAVLAANAWREQQRELRRSDIGSAILAGVGEIYATIEAKIELAQLLRSEWKLTKKQALTQHHILQLLTLAQDSDREIERWRGQIQQVRQHGHQLMAITNDNSLNAVVRFAEVADNYFNRKGIIARACEQAVANPHTEGWKKLIDDFEELVRRTLFDETSETRDSLRVLKTELEGKLRLLITI